MRKKEAVHASDLMTARAARASDDFPWRFFLRFGMTHGLSAVKDREATATMTGEELARAVGAIPVSSVKDPDDLQAIGRVVRLLRSSAYNTRDRNTEE